MVKGYKATFTQRCSIATKLTWIFQERTSTKSSAQLRQGENNFFFSKTPVKMENRQFMQR